MENNQSNSFQNNGNKIEAYNNKLLAIEENNSLIDEIISEKPSFLVRWGTLLFLFMLIIFFIICWFIQYPDVITTPAKLTSINAPKTIVSLSSGKLIKLLKKEENYVKKGDIIAYIEAIGKHEEVLYVKNEIEEALTAINSNEFTKAVQSFKIDMENLGELQISYQNFVQSNLSFKAYLPNGFYTKKYEMLEKDLINIERLHNILLDQKKLMEQDLQLSEKTFHANESLKKEKVISDFDYRTESSKLINKQLTLPQINSAIVSNESLKIDKQKELAELSNTIQQQKILYLQTLNTLKSQVDDWIKKYILVASENGILSFASLTEENQQIQAGQVICYINHNNSKYYAIINIPQTNFGKVKTRQKVLLKLNAYPYQEYGYVEGRISFISAIPTDSGYMAKVNLVNGLATNYHEALQYREGLTAQASIITADKRLLQRFYENFFKIISRN
ncbi:MAG: HlyD family efflux transporter periplasmic adaptor subunit [Hydrotalea sp. AMD]|uniref:HlyD family secretion protein n=1 Tax=Hydrotalea sp. AMD TaxID=2501297 RepID=UPI0010274AEB|nr:HlyD family efflux transporter periplasmic adaptor subunit [Hydrotalea sp. AMD]RWZ86179.1 MAG: HlyD family efflux transporter periplasmic adaptor subunit [Hydrotalea sp. AMD]